MMLDKLILGKKIKEARQRTGLNQSEFGKKIGISKQALSSIERGLYWPGLDTLENISALCGLTLNDFSDKFCNPHKILEEREEYNTFTDRERKLIHRFRLLRDDQKKALEILLHINENHKKQRHHLIMNNGDAIFNAFRELHLEQIVIDYLQLMQ